MVVAKLIPSARENRRYFFMNSSDKKKIENAILEYIGVLGFAKSGFAFIEKDGKLIGSCVRESLENVRASLAFKKIKIQKVSGTIAGLGR
jgi:RNase P/RNase MRP subunit POP5